MSECVVRMEMPHVCITDNGYYGYCPMDRVWCIQRNAPPDITMCEAYEAMTDKIPSWCPIICSLSEGHGTLIDLETAAEGLSERYNSCHMTCGAVMQFLDGLPTIVPAETERSET